MPISDDELKRLDEFLNMNIYADTSSDNHYKELKSYVEGIGKSDHMISICELWLPSAVKDGPYRTIRGAFINGFYWGRQFEKTEQLRAMYIGKDEKI